MASLLSADWVLPVEGPPIENGAVAVENGRIAAVGTREELGAGDNYPNAVIVPGFVNAHSHLEYAVYAGFGDGLANFADWISLHTERKGRIGWDEFVAIARIGAAESLGSGITTVGDCSYSGAAAVACAELGLRAIVYLEVFGSDPDTSLARMDANRTRAGGAWSELVRPGVSPHAPFTASLEVYGACAELGLPVATHISESPSEVAYLRDGGGPWSPYRHLLVPPAGTTGTRLLAEHGLLTSNLVAAHCTILDPDEIDLLARHGTGVAHCPRSNAALGCGIAPLLELRAAGARVGIGTDSPASAPSFDFFDELRWVTFSARARAGRPDVLGAAQTLELATLGSARALGLDGEVGSLVAGKRADMAVISMDGSPYLPWEEPAAAIVFGGSPARVVTTLVGGEVRYERDNFEWHELRRNAAKARRRMLHDDRRVQLRP